jgi:DnaK suppressor protein
MSLVPPASADARGAALSPGQKVRLRERLTERWQAEVTHITELSLRLHDQLDAAPDGGTNGVDERAMVTAVSSSRLELAEIEAALGRLDAGTFGTCQACGTGLPYERLEAMPHVRYCAGCHQGGDP